MDMSADEAERPWIHVDRPVPEESETTPLGHPIGHGGAVDADGTSHRLEAHAIAPKVVPAADHQLAQNVEVKLVEGVHFSDRQGVP